MKNWIFTLMVGLIGAAMYIWLFLNCTTVVIPVGFVFIYATVTGLFQYNLGQKGYLSD